MADAVGAVVDDAEKQQWNWLRAQSLFWHGVLVNDHDSDRGGRPPEDRAADVMRPLVEATPDDPEARFRYAEALRWVGIALPSTEETAATEREAVKQYQAIWDDRWIARRGSLEQDRHRLRLRARQPRADHARVRACRPEDGRSAEDHAAWVLEILALAAEKDGVNADHDRSRRQRPPMPASSAAGIA